MNEKVIYLLNQARSAELGAIHQYRIHHWVSTFFLLKLALLWRRPE